MEDANSKNKNAEKKVHPQQRANCISKTFFCWTLPLLVKGYKKDITEDDLYESLPAHKSEILGDQLEEAWNKEINTKSKPSFAIALIKTFGPEYGKLGINYFIRGFVIALTQPLLIGKLMEYYNPNQTHISKKEAYIYASVIAVSSIINVILDHHYIIDVLFIGMKVRIAASSLLYRKSLRLSKAALVETTTGQIINLMSNDISRFQHGIWCLHDIWSSPLLIIIVSYLLYARLGWTALSGIVVLVAFIPLQLYLAKLSANYRLKTALKTDQRVRLMNEIICGIQVIKMYAWEKPFAKLVNLSRKLEIDQIRAASYVRAINLSVSAFMNSFAMYACILTYVLTGNIIQSEYVYVATSFYEVLMPAIMFLPEAFSSLAETKISIQRVKKFLLSDEIKNENLEILLNKRINDKNLTNESLSNTNLNGNKIFMKNVSVKWNPDMQDNVLNNFNFSASSNQLVAIVGPVGSGKSTLLHVILKELPLLNGTLDVGGTISYSSQEPWLFGASIRQNILFGQPYNESRYKEVIKICALQRDLSMFDYGDRTIVGERGVMLSGGQKARIGLARAVYKEADIYLLDDPLSAVDTHVGKQLFDNCISDFLKNKCTILVTHQLQYLRTVDKIYWFENGQVIDCGNFENLKNSNNNYLKKLELEPDHSKENKAEDEEIKLATSSENLDEPEEVKEKHKTGKISKTIYKSYFQSAGHICFSFLIAFLFILAQCVFSGNDYFVSFWINLEQKRQENSTDISNNTNQTIPTNFEQLKEKFFTSENCMYIYSVLILLVIVTTTTNTLTFFKYCSIASKNLHNNMFSKIVYNSMRFFNTNPSGRILNRFSNDMGSIDETVPKTLLNTMETTLMAVGIVTVVCIVNPWMIIPTVSIFILFYFLRTFFLATTRNLKRIEGTKRSPVFTHMTASLQGLTTIRAFGAQEILRVEFDNYQNAHTEALCMFNNTNRTFGFWLDFNCVLYSGLVTLSFLFIGNNIQSGSVGLAITQSIALTGMLQWGIRQWSELENQMTSVERVIEYTKLVTESHEDTRTPSKDWPTDGNIEFRSVSMQYAPGEPMVLKNLNFKINPREKIGIVGRTGAGKSSLISALFRLADIEGEIIIDGINTKNISLHSLRSKISIIPQEPVLFSGSLRKNIDPFDEFEDSKLWKALEEVKLKQVISELPSGLHSNVSEGGSNFSVGQRQLLCLARAAIRSNKILVLDEATANVDPQTDELIQNTIRRKFADCTVLTIAHRLHTVMDSDKVLVMDTGHAVEFDHPHNLLQNPDGIFSGLVKQTGKGMAEHLMKLAKKEC